MLKESRKASDQEQARELILQVCGGPISVMLNRPIGETVFDEEGRFPGVKSEEEIAWTDTINSVRSHVPIQP